MRVESLRILEGSIWSLYLAGDVPRTSYTTPLMDQGSPKRDEGRAHNPLALLCYDNSGIWTGQD